MINQSFIYNETLDIKGDELYLYIIFRTIRYLNLKTISYKEIKEIFNKKITEKEINDLFHDLVQKKIIEPDEFVLIKRG